MESAFQFTKPSLVGMEFAINQDFNNQGEQEVKINIGINVNTKRNKAKTEAEVTIEVVLGGREGKDPYFIKASESARFRWKDEIEEDMVEKLLNQNASALLISYLRPMITQVTAASPYGAYDIPFIDFTKKRIDNR